MILRLPNDSELRFAYERDFIPAFPPTELKPLRSITSLQKRGLYEPWCLYDGEELLGEAFIWLGRPGWALLDYLCVRGDKRGGGLGKRLLQLLKEKELGRAIIIESELPEWAEDPGLAVRRLGFYERCGAYRASYDSELFGVPYATLYLAPAPIPSDSVCAAHHDLYASALNETLMRRYVRIPRAPGPPEKVEWGHGGAIAERKNR